MRKRKYVAIFLGIVLLLTTGFYLWQNYGWRMGVDISCVKVEKHKIAGQSMEPLLADGVEVKGLVGYYDCNEIKKGEIAVLEFKTREESFVKKIVGLPGDELVFENDQIKLNGKILENSAGEPYLFFEASQRIINIPLKDGKISEGRYLVLGEEKGPSAFDSRQFAFVEKEHLKGRVVGQPIINKWLDLFLQKLSFFSRFFKKSPQVSEEEKNLEIILNSLTAPGEGVEVSEDIIKSLTAPK